MNVVSRYLLALLKRTSWLFSDEIFLRLRFKLEMGTNLNLKNPRTFNEKLQWLKIYNRKPEYTLMVDKYAVKEYVAKRIGNEYIIPTLAIYDKPEDINWNDLPNQFVLKTTHGGGGGGVIICKDKSDFNRNNAIYKLNSSLKYDIYKNYREWPYKDVPKRIIIEQFMNNEGHDLEDYKIHCFNGVPKFILVCRDRFKDSPMIDDFYSTEWKLMDVRRPGHPNSSGPHIPPKELDEMLRLASKLSKDIPFLRVDFYVSNHKVYFGELTFFPASGMSKFEPEEWDLKLGELLKLPSVELLKNY